MLVLESIVDGVSVFKAVAAKRVLVGFGTGPMAVVDDGGVDEGPEEGDAGFSLFSQLNQ